MDIDFSVFRQTQKSGLKQTDPRAFTASAEALARFGQSMQDVGDAGVSFALAEQKAFNTTQLNSTDAQRKVQFGKLKNRLLKPENFDAHTYENKLNSPKIKYIYIHQRW